MSYITLKKKMTHSDSNEKHPSVYFIPGEYLIPTDHLLGISFNQSVRLLEISQTSYLAVMNIPYPYITISWQFSNWNVSALQLQINPDLLTVGKLKT